MIFNFGQNAHLLLKLFLISASVIFLLYAIVIWRQIPIMNKTLNTAGGKILEGIAFFQILVAVFILLLAIIL